MTWLELYLMLAGIMALMAFMSFRESHDGMGLAHKLIAGIVIGALFPVVVLVGLFDVIVNRA